MCHSTNKKPGLERITEKEKEDKVRKQGYTMSFPTKQEVNLAIRFETFDLPPYDKESICNLKTSWKATSVQRPVIVCQMSTPYITRFI